MPPSIEDVFGASLQQSAREKENNLNDPARKKRALATITTYRIAAKSFIEFTEECEGIQEGEAGHGKEYFRGNAPLPTVAKIRAYLIWYCQSSSGKYDGGLLPDADSATELKLMVTTVHSKFKNLLSALAFWNLKPTNSLRLQITPWIDTTLAKQENLNTEIRRKPVVLEKDVNLLIAKLFTKHTMSLFTTSLRYHLYFLIVINLLLDCSNRVGEYLRGYNVKEKFQVLRWQDIEFLAFPSSDAGGQPEIWVIVHWRWGKYRKHKASDKKNKTLHRLPPYLIFEDSATLLLILGLLEGHFADFTNYEELMSAQPPTQGSYLKIKDSALDLPVIRQVAPVSGITAEACTMDFFARRLPLIGESLGYQADQGRLSSYGLRRGIFRMLRGSQPDHIIKQHMGWKHDSHAHVHYQSETLTTDTQALRHGADNSRDMDHLAGVGIARVSEPPLRLTEKGEELARNHPTVVEAQRVAEEAKEELLHKYETMTNAKSAAPTEYREYVRLYEKVQSARLLRRTLIFRSEYRAACMESRLQPLRPAGHSSQSGETQCEIDDTSARQLLEDQLIVEEYGQLEVERMLDMPTADIDAEDIDETLDDSGEEEEGEDGTQGESPVDQSSSIPSDAALADDRQNNIVTQPIHLLPEFALHDRNMLYDRRERYMKGHNKGLWSWFSADLPNIEQLHDRIVTDMSITREDADYALLNFYSSEQTEFNIDAKHVNPEDAEKCKYCGETFDVLLHPVQTGITGTKSKKTRTKRKLVNDSADVSKSDAVPDTQPPKQGKSKKTGANRTLVNDSAPVLRSDAVLDPQLQEQSPACNATPGVTAGHHESPDTSIHTPIQKQAFARRAHVQICSQKAQSVELTDLVQQYLSSLVGKSCDVGGNLTCKQAHIPCGETFQNPEELALHRVRCFQKHIRDPIYCPLLPCHAARRLKVADPALQFPTLDALKIHAAETHNIVFPWKFTSKQADLTTAFCFECKFCEVSVLMPRFSQAAEDHAKSHYVDAQMIIQRGGFPPITVGSVVKTCVNTQFVAKLGFCPFCLINPRFSWQQRLHPIIVKLTYDQHMMTHSDDYVLDGSVLYYCPGSAVTGTDFTYCLFDDSMTGLQLWEHMDACHGIGNPQGKKRKAPEKQTSETKRKTVNTNIEFPEMVVDSEPEDADVNTRPLSVPISDHIAVYRDQGSAAERTSQDPTTHGEGHALTTKSTNTPCGRNNSEYEDEPPRKKVLHESLLDPSLR